MNSTNSNRRKFIKTATSLAIAGGLPTLDSLVNIASAADNPSIGPLEVADDYKAIVCVFLFGGQDHTNILIPYQDGNASGTGSDSTFTEFTRYAAARANITNGNPAGDPPNQTTGTGNLAHTRAQLAATALPGTITNTVTANGGWTNNTYGRSFALNPAYAELKPLYTAGKLAVIGNTGPLISPINRHQWFTNTGGASPANLYSHDDQQKAWMGGNAGISNPLEGIGGRIADQVVALNGNAQVSIAISVSGVNTFMLTSNTNTIPYQVGSGAIGRLQTSGTPPTTNCNTGQSYIDNNPSRPYCVSGGPVRVSSGLSWQPSLYNAFRVRINSNNSLSNVYLNQWSGTMDQSIRTEQAIAAALNNSPPTEEIVAPFVGVTRNANNEFNPLAAQLQMTAALIRASAQLGAQSPAAPLRRQIFFVSLGGFDTHGSEFWDNNPTLNSRVSKAINAFWTAMGNVRVRNATGTYLPNVSAQDRVTLFTMSDFGRTVNSNGKGNDHGWGGHHIVLGGAVKGGHIYGMNHNVVAPPPPVDGKTWMMTDNTAGAVPRVGVPPNPYSSGAGMKIADQLNHALERGELLPTMASDAYIATIARWFGVTPSQLATVFPTLNSAHPGFDAQNGVGFMNVA